MVILSYLLEYNRYLNIVGIFSVLAIAVLFSRNRRAINIKLICNALILEFILAFFILRTAVGKTIFEWISNVVRRIYEFADKGSAFVFGNLVDPSQAWGFIF